MQRSLAQSLNENGGITTATSDGPTNCSVACTLAFSIEVCTTLRITSLRRIEIARAETQQPVWLAKVTQYHIQPVAVALGKSRKKSDGTRYATVLPRRFTEMGKTLRKLCKTPSALVLEITLILCTSRYH